MPASLKSTLVHCIYANILYKGHGKERTLDSSYRTISTCPLVAKALDTYIGELSSSEWEAATAETQFQKPRLSHEHASILLTEVIQNTIFEQKLPLFALYLDAKSAFDKALLEILCRRLYLDGTQGLSIIIQRLQNRITFCEWDKTIMEPINDQVGFEQGGKNSSEHWKTYNNEHLNVPQETDFGVHLNAGDVCCYNRSS